MPRDPPFRYLQAWRINVSAESSTLSALAIALGQALEIPVVVESSVVALQISMTLPGLTVGELLGVLRVEYRIRSTMMGGILFLESESFARFYRGRPEVDDPPRRGTHQGPLEVRLFATPEGISGSQLASALCQSVASPQGRASALGSMVMFTDRQTNIEQAEQMIEELENAAPGASSE